jgi:hypothetical protein
MSTYTKSSQVYFPFRRGTIGWQGAQALSDPDPSWQAPLLFSTAYTNFLQGEKRANWRQIVAQGGNATTPMIAKELSCTNVPMFYHGFGNINPTTNVVSNMRRFKAQVALSSGAPSSMPSNAVDSKADNLARVKASRKIEQIMTSFQGGVFLGELRETLRMIRNPAQALRRGVGNYLDALKKRRRGSRSQREKILADTWLEYSFGWVPFINDLNDARTLLARRAKQLEQELIEFKAVASEAVDLGHFLQSYSSGITLRWYLHDKRSCIVVYAGAVNSAATSPGLINSSALGLSPRSWAPTLWELLPWSFLFDYFTNIGDVIQGWSNQTTSIAWGRQTTIQLYESKAMAVPQSPPATGWGQTYSETFVPGEFHAQLKHVTRNPISNIGPPSFAFEIPGFSTKWLNIAALAASRKRLEPY